MQAHHFYIGMGSNAPEARDLLRTAVRKLSELADGEVLLSTPEANEAIDFPWPATFVNQVASMIAPMEPEELNACLKRIEREAGRTKRETQQGVVRLDLDLLSSDGQVLRLDDWQRSYIQRGIAEIRDMERA